MPIPRSLKRWLRLPSRLTLVLGLGALATTGARADAPDEGNQSAFGGVLIRSEGGKIYLSEGGRETELQLGPTAQRDHLLQLLEEHGSGGVKLDSDPRLIMSGGGGSGFTWVPQRSDTTAPTQTEKAATPPPKNPTPLENAEPPKEATAGKKG